MALTGSLRGRYRPPDGIFRLDLVPSGFGLVSASAKRRHKTKRNQHETKSGLQDGFIFSPKTKSFMPGVAQCWGSPPPRRTPGNHSKTHGVDAPRAPYRWILVGGSIFKRKAAVGTTPGPIHYYTTSSKIVHCDAAVLIPSAARSFAIYSEPYWWLPM